MCKTEKAYEFLIKVLEYIRDKEKVTKQQVLDHFKVNVSDTGFKPGLIGCILREVYVEDKFVINVGRETTKTDTGSTSTCMGYILSPRGYAFLNDHKQLELTKAEQELSKASLDHAKISNKRSSLISYIALGVAIISAGSSILFSLRPIKMDQKQLNIIEKMINSINHKPGNISKHLHKTIPP